MKPRIEVIDETSALEALRSSWADLGMRSARNEPMLAPSWLLPWWRTFGGEGGRSLRVVALRDRGRLVGLAPLLLRTSWYRPGLPFRRLELLGSGEPQADEICSEYIGVLAERGSEHAVARALAQVLAEDLAGEWDELLLPSMAGDGPMPALIAEELARRGLGVHLEATSTAPYVELPTSFQAYLDALPAKRRYLVSRSLRDFERWAGVETKLHCARSRDELAYGRYVLESLHGERWRELGPSGGVFASPRFRAFHDEVMPTLLDAGALDLLWLTARGQPLAALYNIVWQGKVYFYQSGRRLDLPKQIRPGIVIHALAIRRAIEMGLREYDFLAGTTQYKTQLALDARPLVQLRAVRSSLRERARVLLVETQRRLIASREKARAHVRGWRKLG